MILAITSGGDWYDASVNHLVVPDGRNIDDDVASYPGYHACKVWLPEYLKATFGYRDPDENELVYHHDGV